MIAERRTRSAAESPGDITRRELYFFNLYRCFEAVVYAGLVFSPYATAWVRVTHAQLGQIVVIAYLVVALILLVATDRLRVRLAVGISGGLVIDILAAALVLVSVSGHSSVPVMLLVNVGVAALLLPRRAFVFSTLAAIGVLTPAYYANFVDTAGEPRSLFEAGLLAAAYFIVSALFYYLGGHVRATEELAAQRGVDLLNLEQINDLIIQRMKTGVLLVDQANRVLRFNEAAWLLVGSPSPSERDLGTLAPELSRRLYHWRHSGRHDQSSVALAADVPEVIPRFTRLAPNDDANVLIFLDDTSLLSRRAEELTLTSLGRLSASIAHEIRNPLAAIRYSAQLLAEAKLAAEDKRLVDIINNHCTRANEVVENILQLSRRERSRPETLDLNAWVLSFVEDYKQSNDLGGDQLRGVTQNRRIEALVDPQHLQQVIWNLVQNALRYGRVPNEPARVNVLARLGGDNGPPLIEIVDRGPGIPPKVAAQIFEPFFTTHEYGTGLGLYLAKQMSEASQAALEYVPVPGGGACFRLTLMPAGALLASRIAAQQSA